MKKNVDIHDRLLVFSIQMVKLCRFLARNSQDRIIAAQLLRSATSVGANMSEANAACSRKDFINKVNIAKKEALETNYWLKVIKGANILNNSQLVYDELLSESEQLIKIIGSILFNTKNRGNEEL